MMKTRVLLTTVTAGLLGLGVAHAMPGQHNGPSFDSLDTNSDNHLSAAELGKLSKAKAKQRFEKIDVDGNGKISKTEFTLEAKQRAVKLFGQLDSNDDDSLTQEEVASHRNQRHHGKDEARQGMSKGDKTNSSSRTDGHGDRWMKKLDEDKDGRVSREEWNNAMQHKAHKRGDDRSDMSDDSNMDDDAAMSDDAERTDGSRMSQSKGLSNNAEKSDTMNKASDSRMSDDRN